MNLSERIVKGLRKVGYDVPDDLISFKLVAEHNGYERWESLCGRYSLARYVYFNNGKTCGPEHRCDPYWQAYRRYDGKRISDEQVATMALAIEAVNKFDKEN